MGHAKYLIFNDLINLPVRDSLRMGAVTSSCVDAAPRPQKLTEMTRGVRREGGRERERYRGRARGRERKRVRMGKGKRKGED